MEAEVLTLLEEADNQSFLSTRMHFLTEPLTVHHARSRLGLTRRSTFVGLLQSASLL